MLFFDVLDSLARNAFGDVVRRIESGDVAPRPRTPRTRGPRPCALPWVEMARRPLRAPGGRPTRGQRGRQEPAAAAGGQGAQGRPGGADRRRAGGAARGLPRPAAVAREFRGAREAAAGSGARGGQAALHRVQGARGPRRARLPFRRLVRRLCVPLRRAQRLRPAARLLAVPRTSHGCPSPQSGHCLSPALARTP